MFKAMMIFLIALMTGPAFAAHWLSVVPDGPVAGTEVGAEIAWGATGLCRALEENLDGVRYSSTVEGSVIHLDFVTSPIICVPMLPPTFSTYSLGSLAAGDYTLIVSEVGPDTTFPVSDEERAQLASMVFGVAPAPMAIPVNRPLALVLLAGLMLIAGTVFRGRRSNVG